MGDIVERRCYRCGNIYKYEKVPSYILFCPRCKRFDYFEPNYTDNGIIPCRIYLGDEIIGEMTSENDTTYKVVCGKFGVNECFHDSENPYLKAIDIMQEIIGNMYGSMNYRTGELTIHNEVFHKWYTFKQFKKSALYKAQDDVKMFSLEGKYKIDNWIFYVSFFFKYGKLYMISLFCEDPEISFEDEPKRKELHDSILAEYGLSDDEEFVWGSVSSVYDRKSNISSINIIYNLDMINQVELLKEEVKAEILNVVKGLKDDVFLDLIIDQSIFECMKSTFDEEMKETQKSMEKTFFGGLTDKNKESSYDRKKQEHKRNLKKIDYYRNAEGHKLEQLSGIFPEELEKLKKSSNASKSNFDSSNHYKISNQNAIEVDTFGKLEIYEKILGKQITDIKKVSNYKFEDYYKEYDDHYIELIDSVSSYDVTSERYLSVVIDLFNIEDKLSLEWLYSFADYAVKNKINNEVFDRAKWLYFSHIKLSSGLTCMNRAPFLKKEIMPLLLSSDEVEYEICKNVYCNMLEYIVGIKKLISKNLYLSKIPKDEWVQFIKKNYDLLGSFEMNKEWEPEKIRKVRRVIELWNKEIKLPRRK